ncbi:MAG: flagellar biosynthesis protein flip [Rickettsiaceae bacterium]|jgi:flagellar biosynthetic protein FliP|nr:flagellar biosynthesis protein flip [Rickettsiaceae bacterium]
MKYIALFIIALLFVDPASAQTLSLNMGEGGGSATSRIVQIIALITVLSLAPSILVMVTSFTRIIIVFSFLRTAMGLQQTPPNSVLISLALFLTLFIMQPAFTQSYNNGIKPLIDQKITEEQAMQPIVAPFHTFMMTNVRQKDLALFYELSDAKPTDKIEETPLTLLIPAFMISELRRAFEIGFLLFIPFLIIDLMVSSTLMSMGMMMLPPVVVSLPFKLIFFVLIDGWHLVVGSLVKSFGG